MSERVFSHYDSIRGRTVVYNPETARMEVVYKDSTRCFVINLMPLFAQVGQSAGYHPVSYCWGDGLRRVMHNDESNIDYVFDLRTLIDQFP
ncbi:MAG: hypothetical protein Q8Q18_03125 [bacterium]|nr:hypothetical protein [bacterium]